MAKKKKKDADTLATNRKARRNYEILESFEVGIALKGTEVKSIRASHVSIEEAFAQIHNGEVWIHQLRIEAYTHGGNAYNHSPERQRRLLLHKSEIVRLYQKVSQKGYSLIPISLYLKNQRVKIELGLCRGKNVLDKREDMKRRTADREARQAIKAARSRKVSQYNN